jgi:6-phosphogluconolactonase
MRSPPETAVQERHFSSTEDSAQALAMAIADLLRAGIAARGAASLVVSGGKSPVPFFAALRQQTLDWCKVWITLADERWVDPSAADSNERLLREHLLRDAAAAAQFVGLKSAFDTASAGIQASTDALAAIPRPFDAVVLGLGEDGHTASLFPGAIGLEAALDASVAPALVAITPGAAPHARISMNLALLLEARHIFLPLSGAAKLAVYRAALTAPEPLRWPISAVLRQWQTPVEVFIAGSAPGS